VRCGPDDDDDREDIVVPGRGGEGRGGRRGSRVLRRGGGARRRRGGAHVRRGGGRAAEAHAEEERTPTGVWRKMTGLGFSGLGTLKKRILPTGGLTMSALPSLKKNSSEKHDDVINAHCY
jgi:hypothetical protein